MARIPTIKNRRDFLVANASARKFVTHSFILQYVKRADDHPVRTDARIGYTVTKKMGGAVERNRIKRRLREVVKQTMPQHQQSDFDYVVIARQKALACDFSELLRDMEFAFSRIHANKGA